VLENRRPNKYEKRCKDTTLHNFCFHYRAISAKTYLCSKIDTAPMRTLVFATNNAHKAQEVAQILGPEFQIKTLRDIGCTEDIDETAPDLEGNALLKARYVKEKFGLDCFSDDSGLEVSALNGAPGVHTARYAGPGRDAADNNLEGKSDRSAQFRAVFALVEADQELLFEGVCKGRIAMAPQGTGGFGYDPVFIPENYEDTFAILGDDVKNRISHRAIATEKLRAYLNSKR
jgi:XTP/dITP diphosphohydrolase